MMAVFTGAIFSRAQTLRHSSEGRASAPEPIMFLKNGQLNARAKRRWIIEPDGTANPGEYRCRFTRNGPDVPVKLELRTPVDPLTGEELDRSPMWVLRVGWSERAERDPVMFPELSGEPMNPFEYDALYAAGDWREALNDAAEAALLTR